ncbi:MAG: 23S rRNA (uracil(1939)-C(5))-methyltransferase RlmD [Clostridia bacterium]|nr:23S rRNA (uracil(1939)-C(5))-methyltransferase RlmD [Clostridia bacterium]
MKKQPPLKRNDDIEITIDALGSEGQGIGRLDGYTVFVDGALPNERVLVHIIKPMPSYAIGKLIQVLEPSESRIEEPCGVSKRCGGCTLQHLDYDAQLEFKRQRVADAFERIGGFKDISVQPCIGMQHNTGYRNKASFPCAMIDGVVEMGFYAKNSHRLIPIDDCMLQQSESIASMRIVREWANIYNITAYDEQTKKGVLRHVMVRTTTLGQTMVVIVTTGLLPHKDELIDMLISNVLSIESVVHNINPKNTNVILGERFNTIYGMPTVTERICDLDFEVSAASFLQVNPIQTELLYGKVLEFAALCETDTVLDVYCGIGTISLMLARHADFVYGIEEVAEAISDAKRNALRNAITNADFRCGKAEDILPNMIGEGISADCIVIDPPRKGCDEAVLSAIAESGARRVVYVSCNPATLARDSKLLAENGYVPSTIQPVDMFPWTSHVETVMLLQRETL